MVTHIQETRNHASATQAFCSVNVPEGLHEACVQADTVVNVTELCRAAAAYAKLCLTILRLALSHNSSSREAALKPVGLITSLGHSSSSSTRDRADPGGDANR